MPAPTFTRTVINTSEGKLINNENDVAEVQRVINELYGAANPEDRERAEDAADRAELAADLSAGGMARFAFVGGNNDPIVLPLAPTNVLIFANTGLVREADYTLAGDTITPVEGYSWPVGGGFVAMFSVVSQGDLQPTLDFVTEQRAAAEVAAASIQPYASRAEAVAATKAAGQRKFEVIGPDGDTLRYVEDADADYPALTMADGTKLVPDGDATAAHYAIATGGSYRQQTALNAALDAEERLTVTGGTVYTTARVIIPTDTTLDGRRRGDGIERAFTGSETNRQDAIRVLSGTELRNVKIDIGVLPDPDTAWSATISTAVGDTQKVLIEGVTANAGIEIDPEDGSRNGNNAILWPQTGENIDGLMVKDSSFTGHFWGVLQSNPTVATLRNTTILSSSFNDLGSVALLFNAPATGALNENILVAFNYLGANECKRWIVGTGVPGFPHRGSFAGNVRYSRLIGNHGDGNGGELFRAEEQAVASVWLGNTGKLNGRRGFDIIPNNAEGDFSGAPTSPSEFSIVANVLRRVLPDGSQDHSANTPSEDLSVSPDPDKRHRGGLSLQVYETQADKANADALSESVAAANVFSGWGQGLVAGQGAHRTLVVHNVFSQNGVGIAAQGPSMGHADNMLTDNDAAIRFLRSGILGPIHIRSKSAIPDPQTIEVPALRGAVTGWTFETGRTVWPNGATEVEIIDIGVMIEAEVIVSVASDGTAASTMEIGRLSFDGTDLVYTRLSRVASGGLLLSSASAWGIKNGHLGVGVFNSTGSDFNAGRLQVSLRGLHVWG